MGAPATRSLGTSLVLAVFVVAGCGRVRFDPLDASSDVADDAVACPPTYQALGTSCYRFVIDGPMAMWLDVEAACEADGVGSHLAVIDDDIELALLIDQLRLRVTTDAAVGFSDRQQEGTYLTVTGGPAFLVWAPANPDGGNDCGNLDSSVADQGMKDSTCTSNFDDYICEHDQRAADPSAF